MNVLRDILKASDMQTFCCEESSGQMTKVLPPWQLPTDWLWHSSGFVPTQNYPPPFSSVPPITQYHSLLKTWVLCLVSLGALFLACRQPPPLCYVITFFYEFKVLCIKCLYKVDSRVLLWFSLPSPRPFLCGCAINVSSSPSKNISPVCFKAPCLGPHWTWLTPKRPYPKYGHTGGLGFQPMCFGQTRFSL